MSTTITPAQKAAQQIRSQVFGLQRNIQQAVPRFQALLTKGLPAQGTNPAISPDELATALGSADLATINAILAALDAALPADS